MSVQNSIGLLDFQSKRPPFTPLINGSSVKRDLQQPIKRSSHGQNFEATKSTNQDQSSACAQIETCNLEDLISSTSLMYVSGDSQGLDSTKLQLVFCKESCCDFREKYARVQRDKNSDYCNKSNKVNSIAPISRINNTIPSWDLGSDGAGSPIALGGTGWQRSSPQWPGPPGFEPSNAVFFDKSLTDAFYETDESYGTYGSFKQNGTESVSLGDIWNN